MNGAWIFLSIGDGGGTREWVSLEDLIGAADANNHAIPTQDELEVSVSNLVAAGLVETDGPRTRLTVAGNRAYEQAGRRRVGHIQRMFDLADEWQKAGYPPRSERTWFLSEAILDASHRSYTEAMGRLLTEEEGRR